ncbi:hypothetical protein [Tropicibacter oceani]|uniref:Flagellar FliJ protein n=1 Tax=Tropicibacter oceani TaxID=3058420 RepID=A0ABY8QJ24_9RHOB|nr:hypothetical protein [Tropicibacter oceani]WGW04640.1 hypothetical protein QF118_03565 [Tropicibacter oceani]
MTQNYQDLIQVSDLLQERALNKHRQNLTESRRLKQELAQIDNYRQAVQADTASLGARRLSGADTLWQTWLVRKRASILQEMAMARAKEADSLARAKTAQARFDAARDLQAEEQRKSREKRLLAQTETLEALGRLRGGFGEDW